MNIGNPLGQASAAGQVAAPETVNKGQPVDASQTGAAQASASQPRTIQDQVQFSSASGLVAAALRVSDVRTAKVEQLQAAIGSGSYNVSSSAVADKVIGSLLQ